MLGKREKNGERRREVRREDRWRGMDWRAARACLTPPALSRVRQVLGAVASPPPPPPGGPSAGPSLQAAAGTIPCWGRKSYAEWHLRKFEQMPNLHTLCVTWGNLTPELQAFLTALGFPFLFFPRGRLMLCVKSFYIDDG